MTFDEEKVKQAWESMFKETLEEGLNRVGVLLNRFGVMDRFERAALHDEFAEIRGFTRMDDKDFARVAVLAMAGASSLGVDLASRTPRLEDRGDGLNK